MAKYFRQRKAKKIKKARKQGYQWAMYEYTVNGMAIEEIMSYIHKSCIWVMTTSVDNSYAQASNKNLSREEAFDLGAEDAVRYIKCNIINNSRDIRNGSK